MKTNQKKNNGAVPEKDTSRYFGVTRRCYSVKFLNNNDPYYY